MEKKRKTGKAAPETAASLKFKESLSEMITENTKRYGDKKRFAEKMGQIGGGNFSASTITAIQNGRYNKAKSNNPGIDTVCLLLDAMGLELVIKPKCES